MNGIAWGEKSTKGHLECVFQKLTGMKEGTTLMAGF